MKQNNKCNELLKLADTASKNAYSPYSKLNVGAAILTRNGGFYTGCNVENVSFSITSCAERNAIAAAILAEGPKMIIDSIAIAAKDCNNNNKPITPCGACRQAIIEFCTNADVIYKTEGEDVAVVEINSLIPHSFEANFV